MDIDGSNKQRLTSRDDTYDYFPTWSPDGRYIAFNSSEQHDHNGDWKLFMLELETNEIIPLFDSPGNDVFPDWFQ
jgi:Tol biopolymer transport system component